MTARICLDPLPFSARPGVAMTLTAPATFAGRPFARWLIQGNPQTPLLRTLDINSADGHYLAEYGVHSNGSFRSFGTGCPGRSGNLGQQASATVVPDIGHRPLYTVFNAFPLGTALMFEGFSSSNWGGIPLPATIPGTTCTIYTDLTIAYPALAVNLAGLASTTVFIPNDVNLIGGRYYTQWLGIDGTTTLGFTLSNAIETTIGGTR